LVVHQLAQLGCVVHASNSQRNLKLHPKLTKLVQLTLTVVTVCLLFAKALVAADPISIGGSNYGWYNIDTSAINQNRNCREQFGIIANYHQQNVSSTVRQQLATMFQNGQRRLRVPIFHASDLSSGTVLRSAGGNLTGEGRRNLANFLADIKAAGFQEILVGFHPISRSSPHTWVNYDPAIAQENWNLIQNLRPIIRGANIDYKIDLWNEGAASSTQSFARQYTGELWSLYNAAYGKSDTVGFSVATGSRVEAANPDRSVIGNLAADRYTVMKQVYDETGYGAPTVWDFHFYDDLDRKFKKVDDAMISNGDNTNIIIGETYYQGLTALSQIQSITTTRDILAVYAWPVTEARGCDGHVDIRFPAQYHYGPRQSATAVTQQPAEIVSVVPTTPQQPVVVPQTLLVEPVTQQPATVSPPFALCASGASDHDGDGWGWENEQSCQVTNASTDGAMQTTNEIVTDISSIPICQTASSDLDGDGYGWENNESCIVTELSTSSATNTPATAVAINITDTPFCQLENSDSDGDGYGWENQTSCIVR